MADSVRQPGVYIEELSGLSLSVSSSPTAVPVFIADFGKAFEGAVRVAGWAELPQVAGDGAAAGVTGDVLRSYFENGGGSCYLANTAGGSVQGALTALESFDDVTILVPLGLWDQGADVAGETARAVAAYAAGHRAMAILHADRDHDAAQCIAAARAFKLDAGQSAHAALYYPWLIPTGDGAQPLPPVGAVTGAWCKVDREHGVWKAPANIELKGVRPSQEVTDEQQGEARHANAIRALQGMGTIIWGARTLDEASDEWQYIPVRRLVDTVERDVLKALELARHESNTQPTWEKVRSAVDTYLHEIWQQGGLMGNTDKEAYYVQVGQGITMTDDDVKAGRMIVKVGLAAVRPADYIILTLTETIAQL
ncbi:phage tail sheath C-terminal domain-containing protein [Streptomyces sp. NBC_00347]|uniref:phage tail sheath family protein n=1 Tax=Streptomyces sp. NBC_00347 TaxID=2975721 RepID=UPI002258C006|nr:phage tail sheath C-terminal domain-containing protein [Streptomyces sp. NBC_00347]MCX5129997.1 phage tail sheath subtilisin-like domain-containing protein [Streptomyces sp. NBC_00347]